MKARLAEIQSKIHEACQSAGRAPSEVKLIAVSKTKSAEEIKMLADLGVKDFGENYIQEALPKIEALAGYRLNWHFIGGLQSNKVKFVPKKFSLLHTLDSLSLAQKMGRAAEAKGITQNCLLEVNVNGELSKTGFSAEQIKPMLEALGKIVSLKVEGLMCIPAPGNAGAFARLRELRDELNQSGAYPWPMRELSMGMSADFPAAIREGATMVRVGTALFGERKA